LPPLREGTCTSVPRAGQSETARWTRRAGDESLFCYSTSAGRFSEREDKAFPAACRQCRRQHPSDPLHDAAGGETTEIVVVILKAKASVAKQTASSETALFLAASKQHTETTRVLLK